MKKYLIMGRSFFLIRKFLPFFLGCFLSVLSSAQNEPFVTEIDGASKYQVMDGFGVNIGAAWWYKGEYRDSKIVQPAIDLLIDSLGATLFRVVIEEIDWESENDDNDAENFNWNYYDKVFTSARFQSIWNSMRYLNKRGIEDGLMISFMGGPPAAKPLAPPDPEKSWMGNTNYSVSVGMEDEFVESIAALLHYARYKAGIRFKHVSPMNETDITSTTKTEKHPFGIVEGPDMPDAGQFVRVIKKLAIKLDKIGMSDIRFVTPDAAGDKLFNTVCNEMTGDTYLMGKLSHWGVHQYGNDAENYRKIIDRRENTNKSYWVTETAGIRNIMGQLDDNASAHFFWDGFDCVYQHGIRNGYGTDPPNDWVYWEGEQGKPLIALNADEMGWSPRKSFYEFAQLFRFVRPGAVRIGTTIKDKSLPVHAWLNENGQLIITGFNSSSKTIQFEGDMKNLSVFGDFRLFITNTDQNLRDSRDFKVSENKIVATIPAGGIFTFTAFPEGALSGPDNFKPEPADWFAGDMHVHRNCGEVTRIVPEAELADMMETNDLAVVTLLADMGNGEVKDNLTDLPKVNGSDAPQSKPGRIIHWDAEWHFDPAGVTFENKALGGHIILLGLKEAQTIWDESPYRIIEWGKKQDAIAGFAHMQYLNNEIQTELDCCIPIDYPVEAALGTIDFLSEDVWLNDAAVKSYYRLLNCGFRLGWAAGTDFPCNGSKPLGSLLTYVQVKDQPLTYRKWIEGIKNGRTVVTTNGHVEFLDLKVNQMFTPGDEIILKKKGKVSVNVTWTSKTEQSGYIEILCNGKIVARQEGNSKPGYPVNLLTEIPVTQSSWIVARRMDGKGHQSHTAPVYITLGKQPVRASAADADYFVKWIDNILVSINENGPWSKYFTKDVDTVKARYKKARDIYKEIAMEAVKINKD